MKCAIRLGLYIALLLLVGPVKLSPEVRLGLVVWVALARCCALDHFSAIGVKRKREWQWRQSDRCTTAKGSAGLPRLGDGVWLRGR